MIFIDAPVQHPILFALVLALHLSPARAANPAFDGWYADPEVAVFGNEYWIYPTYSAEYAKQTFMDAFSSKDLVNWKKHPRILDEKDFKWAKFALWAPCVVHKDGRYYLFFAANDVQLGKIGGIGIGVADNPAGPFKDYLGEPLIKEHHNGAQPIDQSVFRDTDGQWYILYGGWRHCNLARLKDDFTGLVPFDDGRLIHEVTPKDYVEGPIMFRRNGKVYFMWSEGAWTNASYQVAYAIADTIEGPFNRIGTVIKTDPSIATGAGHHSVLKLPDKDEWYMVYHRRPPGETDGNSRVVCIDRMEFNDDGTIKPVVMTNEGVDPRPLE